MEVRDRRYKKSEYKGHYIEAGAGNEDCPCLPCFSIHNCDYKIGKKYIDNFVCLTKHYNGCPNMLEKPTHIVKLKNKTKNSNIRKCLRCGQKIDLSKVNFKLKKERD